MFARGFVILTVLFCSLFTLGSAEECYRELDDNTFSQAIASGTVVVDFYATWCRPCKNFAPIFEQVAKEKQGELAFAKVDIDEAPNAASSHQIRMIPTIVIYKDGKEVKRNVGSMNKSSFLNFLESDL